MRPPIRTSFFWHRSNKARHVQERPAQGHISWSPLTYLCSPETISRLTWYATLILRPVTLALKMSSFSPHLTRTSVPQGISSLALSWLCKDYHDINNSLHLVQKCARILSTNIICFEKRTVSFEGQIMSTDKYVNTFSAKWRLLC